MAAGRRSDSLPLAWLANSKCLGVPAPGRVPPSETRLKTARPVPRLALCAGTPRIELSFEAGGCDSKDDPVMCARIPYRDQPFARVLWLAIAAALVANEPGLLRACGACETLGKSCCSTDLHPGSHVRFAAERSARHDDVSGCPLCRAQAAGGHASGSIGVDRSDTACGLEKSAACDCQLAPRDQAPASAQDVQRSSVDLPGTAGTWPNVSFETADGVQGSTDPNSFPGFVPRPARILFGVWRN